MDKRPERTRPVEGPCLHLLSPDPLVVKDGRWLHQTLASGAYVYPHDIQWRSAHVLLENPMFRVPQDLRYLISRVHGDDLAPLPEPLEHAEVRNEGREIAEAAKALQNVLHPRNGYSLEGIHNDQIYPTRLGEPQVTIVLTQIASDGLEPWARHPLPAKALALSEVQTSLKKYLKLKNKPDQERDDVRQFTSSWKDWERKLKVVAVVQDDGMISEGLAYDPRRGLLISAK